MKIIEVKNLEKNYGSLKAVDDISFSVEKGEIFGILGPNGAGKTTTLEMIEGLRKPDVGSITIDGVSVWPNPAQTKNIIGVQLQTTSLFDFLKVGEIVELFASFYGIIKDKKILSKLIEDVSLTSKAKSYVNELSGGQQQRLSIALALVNDPKVVFLDEPTTGLDPQARRNLWDVIKRINNEGKTVVLTTHYMEEAQILCKRIAIMDQSQIISLDSPDNLIRNLDADTKLTFTSANNLDLDEFSKLKGIKSLKYDDSIYTVYADDIQNAVVSVLRESEKQTAKLENINISGANLEDVFLNLTGRALRN